MSLPQDLDLEFDRGLRAGRFLGAVCGGLLGVIGGLALVGATVALMRLLGN